MAAAGLVVPLRYNSSQEEFEQWMSNLYQAMQALQAGSSFSLSGALITQLLQQPGALSKLQSFQGDTQAAAAGVPIGGIYRRGNVLQVRVV